MLDRYEELDARLDAAHKALRRLGASPTSGVELTTTEVYVALVEVEEDRVARLEAEHARQLAGLGRPARR